MPHRLRPVLGGVLAGLVAYLTFLGVAELVAVAFSPDAAPSIAIGQNVVSHTPPALKNFAVRHFGENDKTVLLTGIYIVTGLVAAAIGAVASLSRRAVALAGAGVLGVLAAVSAATSAAGSATDAIPSLLGGAAAAGVALALLPARAGGDPPAWWGRGPKPVDAAGPGPATVSRRRVLLGGGALAAFGAGTYAIGRTALRSVYNATASRVAVKLPAPTSRTAAVSGTSLDVAGLASYYTPNRAFYRVDTALVVPQLRTDTYRLKVHGMVERPATYGYDQLLAMPMVERPITLVCVSNQVGGPYLGNARWLGILLADFLRAHKVHPDADQLFMTSSDGMTIGADLRRIMDGRPALLAVGMNGEPLPFEHGFPVRTVIPGIYGYASACKWLVDMEVTTYAAKKAYWTTRGYDAKAPVKLESKIDTPASLATLRAGTVTVAGSAWEPTVGISRVQVQVDGGAWHDATLAAADSVDTWRLWRWDWQATKGSHTLVVRAIDKRGNVQTAKEAAVEPNGTSGRQSLVVNVS